MLKLPNSGRGRGRAQKSRGLREGGGGGGVRETLKKRARKGISAKAGSSLPLIYFQYIRMETAMNKRNKVNYSNKVRFKPWRKYMQYVNSLSSHHPAVL